MSTVTSAGADPTSKSIESTTEVIPTTMTGIDRVAAAGTGGTAEVVVTGITEAAGTTGGEGEMTGGESERTGGLPGPSCASSTCAAAKAAT